jgi:hypothetical protein
VHKLGVRGYVFDVVGRPIRASVRVVGLPNITIWSDDDHGDYYRLLMPGRYQVWAYANGKRSAVQDIHVLRDQVTYCTSLAPSHPRALISRTSPARAQ